MSSLSVTLPLRSGWVAVIVASDSPPDPARLDAARRLRQPRDLAGTLGRPGREELVDLVELHAVVLADLADHRCHAELLVVLAQIIHELPVLLAELLHALGLCERQRDVLVPLLGRDDEAVFVQVEHRVTDLELCHCFSPCCWLTEYNLMVNCFREAAIAARDSRYGPRRRAGLPSPQPPPPPPPPAPAPPRPA